MYMYTTMLYLAAFLCPHWLQLRMDQMETVEWKMSQARVEEHYQVVVGAFLPPWPHW